MCSRRSSCGCERENSLERTLECARREARAAAASARQAHEEAERAAAAVDEAIEQVERTENSGSCGCGVFTYRDFRNSCSNCNSWCRCNG